VVLLHKVSDIQFVPEPRLAPVARAPVVRKADAPGHLNSFVQQPAHKVGRVLPVKFVRVVRRRGFRLVRAAVPVDAIIRLP
jgi:hypothetical protein